MEGRQRVVYHILLVVVGTAVFLLSGLAAIRYDEIYNAFSLNTVKALKVYDHDRQLRRAVDQLPRCAHSCLVNELTYLGCAYSDYHCLCQRLKTLSDPCRPQIGRRDIKFETCMSGCSNDDQWFSPGLLLDICNAVDVRAVLPKFMLQNFKAHGRRQNISFAITFTDESSTPTRFTSDVETIYTTWTNRRAASTFTITTSIGTTPMVQVNVPDDSALLVSSLLSAASASASEAFSRMTASLGPFRTSGVASRTGSSIQQATTSGGAVDSGSSGKESSSGGTSGRREGGFGTAAMIGIAVGLIVILFLVGGLILWYRKRKGKATETENAIGGGTNPTSTIPGMAEVDGQSSQQPPAYDKHYGKETVTTPPPVVAKPESAYLSAVSPTSPGAHELSSQHSHSGVASATGGVATHYNDPDRQELSASESLPTKAELPSTPAQTYAPVIGRKPVSPRPISESTSPPPWDYVYSPGNDVSSVSEQGTTTIGSGVTGVSRGDHETRAMEEEMARIRAQKERLQQLNVLEQREEELRRQMEARKSGNAS